MSVISTVEKNVDSSGVETYDSGDDWEIGVGNLIIDLDADLEKDRQKLEMKRFGNIKACAKDYESIASNCTNATSAVSDGLTFPPVQTPAPLGNPTKDTGRGKVKRSKTSKDANKSTAPNTLFGITDMCSGVSQDVQGRCGEAFAMNSALGQADSNPNTSDVTASCAKGKEEKNCKNQNRGLKRERDAAKTRKEKQDVGQTCFGSLSGNLYGCGSNESPCHCGENGIGDITKSGMDSGIMESAIVGKRNDDETDTPVKKLKTEKVDSLFPVPAPPPQAAQATPIYASLSPSISSPSEQLLVRTRSVGTNTREAGNSTEPVCLGPCQPGTTVNLEGIVWHETEEGVLVVNVTWRKRTYVGTLLDCTKHDWAPPRFCESPTSEFEMRGMRGRGKRMRLAIPHLPDMEPGYPKAKGLPLKGRGGGGGRRVSLTNFIGGCRTPPFFSVDEVKPSSGVPSGKRKGKLAPADLDLSSPNREDGRSGKRIRAKSRSTLSTAQGKSDPVSTDQGCSSPTLIDCPHPNCNKKYKHINGLRYHQTHAHLELEAEAEAGLSDCEESLSTISLDFPDSVESPLKSAPLCKLGASKCRRVLLGNDQSGPVANLKARRHSGTKEGTVDDLSNLPIISNMTVMLENCLVTDRNLSVEMPKLEAEGPIERKVPCDKSKKTNGKVDKCMSKSKMTRLIAPAPPPPKLIAIPTAAFATGSPGTVPHRSSPTAVLAHTVAKSPLLKPIRPKASIVGKPGLLSAAPALGKDSRRKEKRRFKDRDGKEARGTRSDQKLLNMEEVKGMGKESLPASLLKEHLSKQDIASGTSGSQGNRLASIRAEADKVYTFTDNAPSPSIGSSSRLEGGPPSSGDGKTNSPAYSDISDAADDGGVDGRSEGARSRPSLPPETSSNKDIVVKEAQVKEPQSPYYHGYDPYYLPAYLQSGQPNASGFPNSAALHESSPKTEDLQEDSEEKENAECLDGKKTETINSGPQSQLQLAMMQTQTALAQSLYYGQYARGLYMDQKLLVLSNAYRTPYEKFYEDHRQFAEQKMSNREGEQNEQMKEDMGQKVISSAVPSTKPSDKTCCTKPGLNEEPGILHISATQQQQGKLANEMHNQQHFQDVVGKLTMDSVKQAFLDPKLSITHDSEAHSWYRPYESRNAEQENRDFEKMPTEVSTDKTKEKDLPLGLTNPVEAEPKDPKHQDPPLGHMEDCDRTEEREAGESRSTRVAVPSPVSPSYIQYQHSYPYLQMCDPSNVAYKVMSPALVHSYPGFHYPLYGKTAGREESEATQARRGVTGKPACESAALELLRHHKPPIGPAERDSPKRERVLEREREHTPFARHLHTHHHTHLGVGYPLIPGQYDPYQGAAGLSAAAVVSSQQVAAQTSATGNDGKL